ncbi:MAG: energy transducer TonB, partial [Bacteroidales bacterium]|nr:energy transducer TonB [Bacteroidales bacterium]
VYKYLRDNIRYPVIAMESGIQGRVYLTFVVEKNGSITDVKVMRGIGGGCDEEAVRVVQKMPKWNPGKQRGRPVRVLYSIPVIFTLN